VDLDQVEMHMWRRREIENYLCTRATLESYANGTAAQTALGPLFAVPAMHEAIEEVAEALTILGRSSPWSPEVKASDEFLTPLFAAYYRKLKLPNLMAKKNFYVLAKYVPDDEIDPEICEKLDAIVTIAQQAKGLQKH